MGKKGSFEGEFLANIGNGEVMVLLFPFFSLLDEGGGEVDTVVGGRFGNVMGEHPLSACEVKER